VRVARSARQLADSNAACSRELASSRAWRRRSARIPRISSVLALPSPAPPRRDLAALTRVDLRLADVGDPLVHQAPERRHALVLHAVSATSCASRSTPSRSWRACSYGARKERSPVSRYPRLPVSRSDHHAEELLGVVGELQVVLHQAHELLFELSVRGRRAIEAPAQHRDDEQRAQKDSPEEGALEYAHLARLWHGRAAAVLLFTRYGRATHRYRKEAKRSARARARTPP
jgi:hypothetical protein